MQNISYITFYNWKYSIYPTDVRYTASNIKNDKNMIKNKNK